MVYSFLLFIRLSEPVGVTENYTSPGSDTWAPGGPGERTSRSLPCGTTHPSPSNQFQKQSRLLVGKCFEMAGHCESCTISLMGNGFHQIDCSVMPSVPHGQDVSERSSCQLQERYSLNLRNPSVLGRGTGILPGTCLNAEG